jgi:hypothetical protein
LWGTDEGKSNLGGLNVKSLLKPLIFFGIGKFVKGLPFHSIMGG